MSSVQVRRYRVQAIWLLATVAMVAALSAPASSVLQAADPAAKLDPTETPTVKWLPKARPVPSAEAQSEADMKAYTEEIPGTDAKFDMVPIRGGVFTMGSPENEKGRKPDESPQHKVAIEPFWMGKCEVTWDEYEQWSMGLDLQRRKMKGISADAYDELADAVARPTMPYSDMTFGMGKEGYPAICMTQLSAKMYCKWLSAKTGRFYRLPTEAEWEYACRAGTAAAYSFGEEPEKLGEYAWYFENSDDHYHKVGQKKPNPWGLFDMHGNVNEWVLDQYVGNSYGLVQEPELDQDESKTASQLRFYRISCISTRRCGLLRRNNPRWFPFLCGCGSRRARLRCFRWQEIVPLAAPGALYDRSGEEFIKNPLVVPKTLDPRCVRGGSWDDDAEALRSAARRGSTKDWKMQDPQIPQSIWYLTDAVFLGFRVVRPLSTPDPEKAKLYEPEYEMVKEYKEARGGKQ